MPNHIRVSASAVVIRDSKLLLVKFNDKTGEHYNLPGGGAEPYESAIECCIRETLEETCAVVQVDRLLLVREYEPLRAGNRFGKRHKLNLIFACTIDAASEPRLPRLPDAHQVGVEWVALSQLPHINLVSKTLPQQILDALAGIAPLYVTESPL